LFFIVNLDALLHRCTQGIYDNIIYHIVVKRCAKIPAHNGFLARRIAGPGLAAEYFYQVSSPEVLAALESLIERNELRVYRSYVERILKKPVEEYRFVEFNSKTKNERKFLVLDDFLMKHFDHFQRR
jgi:hypothetical protein